MSTHQNHLAETNVITTHNIGFDKQLLMFYNLKLRYFFLLGALIAYMFAHFYYRVCSPPEPFLLLLYNPTHSKPEFYECSTTTGSSTMTFDIYSGYEAVQLSKVNFLAQLFSEK